MKKFLERHMNRLYGFIAGVITACAAIGGLLMLFMWSVERWANERPKPYSSYYSKRSG